MIFLLLRRRTCYDRHRTIIRHTRGSSSSSSFPHKASLYIRMLVAAARACHLRVCWNSDRVCWRNYLRHSIRWHPLHCLHTALLLLPPRKPTQNKENGFRHSLVCVWPFCFPLPCSLYGQFCNGIQIFLISISVDCYINTIGNRNEMWEKQIRLPAVGLTVIFSFGRFFFVKKQNKIRFSNHGASIRHHTPQRL